MNKIYQLSIITALSISSICFADEANPQPQFESLSPGQFQLSWTGEPNWSYFVQTSTDLQAWSYLPEMTWGIVNNPYVFVPTNGSGQALSEFFTRLQMTNLPVDSLAAAENADFDGDGWSNIFELQTILTSPLLKDTDSNGVLDGAESNDGDEFPDAWEIEHFGNLTTLTAADADLDLDGDGISNGFEAQMRTDPNSDQSIETSSRENYTYTLVGRLESVQDDHKSMNFSFDDEGNLESAR
ncbi:MAG: hypothetical protein ACSHX0_13465 [Akkermansiaceae bacterium]